MRSLAIPILAVLTFSLSLPSLRIPSNLDLSEMIPAKIIISDRAAFWVLVVLAAKKVGILR